MNLTWELIPEHHIMDKELERVHALFSFDDSPAFSVIVWDRENLDSTWCCDGGILKKECIKNNYDGRNLEAFFLDRFYDELVEATKNFLIKEML